MRVQIASAELLNRIGSVYPGRSKPISLTGALLQAHQTQTGLVFILTPKGRSFLDL